MAGQASTTAVTELAPADVYAQLEELLPAITKDGIDEGQAYFTRRATQGKTSGSKGGGHLHIRAGVAVIDHEPQDRWFRQLGERAIGNHGEEFASITSNKVATALTFLRDTDVAVEEFGHIIPDKEDGQRYTGGVCYRAFLRVGGYVYEVYIVVACSGVVGTDDRAVAYVIALTMASEWTKALKHILGIG